METCHFSVAWKIILNKKIWVILPEKQVCAHLLPVSFWHWSGQQSLSLSSAHTVNMCCSLPRADWWRIVLIIQTDSTNLWIWQYFGVLCVYCGWSLASCSVKSLFFGPRGAGLQTRKGFQASLGLDKFSTDRVSLLGLYYNIQPCFCSGISLNYSIHKHFNILSHTEWSSEMRRQRFFFVKCKVMSQLYFLC